MVHVCQECGQGYERAGFCAADGHPLADSTDPVLGTEVLRYRLARLIGRGGMGNVYLGVQPQIGSRVAIKILSSECAREPELVERFFAEARAVNLIRHENIVSVIDMARMPDGRPFIVMEYIEGLTLARVIKNGPLPLGGVVQVFSDVLSALDAAHAIGIVHRDLKPDNIIITGKGHAKVLDFGIAKLAPALRAHASGPRTETGALLGTPAYMAPEQISGSGGVDGRSDVYGAGVVLFETVTGRVPFAGATLFDMMRAQLEDSPPSPCALRPDLPAKMEAVILTALSKRPDMRFQSAAAMANALEHASMELPQEQWRELSTRNAPLTRGSAPRVRPPTTAPPPQTVRHLRDTPPAISAANVPRSQENDKPTQKKSKRGLWLAVGGMCVAAGVGAIIATSFGGDGNVQPETKPVQTVAMAGTDATLAPQPKAAEREKVEAPAAPAQGSVVDSSKPVEQKPVVEKPLAEKQEKPVEMAEKAKTPMGKAKPVRKEREVVVAEQEVQKPTPASAPVPATASLREQIAHEYGMHSDHVAIPGEVPIKRRPRMSRGKYSPANFDYKSFLPQATKLARAEFSDAKLINFEVHGVAPDGRANITRESGGNPGAQFRFKTNNPVDEGCIVVVDVFVKAIETYVHNAVMCGTPISLPKCSFAQVWEKAREKGTKSEVAGLDFGVNGWNFSATDLHWTLPDDCQ